MGLPSEGNASGAVNGTSFYDDNGSLQKESPLALANGQSQQRYGSMDNGAPLPDRSERQLSNTSEADPRQRPRADKRRPSGQSRVCGKCQQHLTGQFVRALGDTYHLECFTCYVRSTFAANG